LNFIVGVLDLIEHETALRRMFRACLNPIGKTEAEVILTLKSRFTWIVESIVFVVLACAEDFTAIIELRVSRVHFFLTPVESIVEPIELRIVVLGWIFGGAVLGGVAEKRVIGVEAGLGFETAGEEFGGSEVVDDTFFIVVHY
jgi:hypothetical protein